MSTTKKLNCHILDAPRLRPPDRARIAEAYTHTIRHADRCTLLWHGYFTYSGRFSPAGGLTEIKI
ncbi:MAG: hypothetical protein HQL05_02035 [Nitrospirae bacterium]|uniref:hypothetical protein n=1 Tax=Candidatus Magnetobacterium casense TaxID=1455061 RepID=UPI000590EDBA|nr:hypothetical protein [Candidatus Magnetobacterium casensis]MBF0336589.1 hypothetical protein [Nitrospirota bacterium]